jgi:hypothetical protein
MVEIENLALRRRPDGVKCCHHIAKTKKRLSSHGKQKDRAKKQKTLQSLDRIPSQVQAREVVVDRITKYSNDHLQMQHHLSNNYVTYQVSDTTCYVKLNPVQPETVLEEETERTVAKGDPTEDAQFLANSKQKQHLIPRLEQMQVVKLVDVTKSLGDKFLVCSCPFFHQMGMCCWHIYSVTKEDPSQEDTIVYWWKRQGLLALHGQGRLDETLPVVKELIKKHKSYPGIPACGLDVLPQQPYHPDIRTDYFVSTLVSSHIKCTGHWATRGGEDTLQVVLQRLNRSDAWI